MFISTGALPVHLTQTNRERSLQAAKTYELMSAVRNRRRDQKSQKGSQHRYWFPLRRLA